MDALALFVLLLRYEEDVMAVRPMDRTALSRLLQHSVVEAADFLKRVANDIYIRAEVGHR